MEFPPYKIYTHVLEYIQYRGLNLMEESNISRDTFIANIKRDDVFQVIAKNKNGKNVIVVIILEESGYSTSKPKLEKLLVSIERKTSVAEVIIVAEPEFFTKKNLISLIQLYQKKSSGTYYMAFSYYVFSNNVPNYVGVPKHSILTDEEAEEYLSQERITREDLFNIFNNDPAIAWLNGKPGQIARIERISENAGVAIVYRAIIKANLQITRPKK